jgi:hypothetical protein
MYPRPKGLIKSEGELGIRTNIILSLLKEKT